MQGQGKVFEEPVKGGELFAGGETLKSREDERDDLEQRKITEEGNEGPNTILSKGEMSPIANVYHESEATFKGTVDERAEPPEPVSAFDATSAPQRTRTREGSGLVSGEESKVIFTFSKTNVPSPEKARTESVNANTFLQRVKKTHNQQLYSVTASREVGEPVPPARGSQSP